VFFSPTQQSHGTYNRRDEFERFLKKIPADVLIVLDEAYFEYVDCAEYPTAGIIIRSSNLILLRTFSRFTGWRLRLGYGIARPEIITALHRVRRLSMSPPGTGAGLGALEDHEFTKRTRISIARNGARHRALRALKIPFLPSLGNF